MHKPDQDRTCSHSKFIQQQEESHESFKGFLSTLPRERGWLVSHLYNYKGFWHSPAELQGTLACQTHFEAQDGDILVVTSPKSGTTWLKALTFTLVNRGLYPVDDEQHPLITKNPHELVPFLEFKLYYGGQIPDLSSIPFPRLFATHIPYNSLPKSVHTSSTCKLVYLCRDAKDTFVSIWHFANKVRPQNMGSISLEDAFDMFCRGVTLCGPFWDHVLGYLKASLETPNKILFLNYEEMKESPVTQLKRLANFLGCPFTSEEESSGLIEDIIKLCSFDNLSNFEVNKSGVLPSGLSNNALFRRGVVGDWKNYLKPEMVSQLDSITQHKFKEFGLRV